LNSDEVMAAAKLTAARVLKETKSPEEFIQRAFRLALGRGPSATEREFATQFLATCPGEPRDSSKSNAPTNGGVAMIAAQELCRALFNLNSFLYVD
jgi:hypothetical protein